MGLETRPPEGRPATAACEAAPLERRDASPPPDLPPIAAKADDLEAIRNAVDDAAAVSGALWFSYLFALLYFAVAAGAVTHEDLFFERAVKLPFLNMELPLLAFFFLAPILFVVGHAYVLVHLVMLTDKGTRYDKSLDDQIKENGDLSKEERNRRAAIHAGLRQQLPSNIFVQFLAGPKELCESAFGWALRAIAWITLVIAPILLLLMMQIQFLSFHSSPITWTQRAALAVDLFFIWWLWSRILSGREVDGTPRKSAHWMRPAVGVLSVGVLLFSWGVATFPGEWQDNLPNQGVFWFPFPKPDRELVTLNRLVFQSDVDPTTRRRWFPFSNTLVLTGLNVYEGLGIDDPEKIRGRDFVFRARGRDLRGAIFDYATVPKVDFTRADLQGASLDQADFHAASLEGGQLQGANLSGARLQGASLNSANLQAASLRGAQLQGASLVFADIKGANLFGAHLQGASFEAAHLQGADLMGAQLQGAWLTFSQLEGARLSQARLEAASLYGAELQGASLQEAIMFATDLSEAFLWRTNSTSLPVPAWTAPAVVKQVNVKWQPLSRATGNTANPWNDKAYHALKSAIESLPPGDNRDGALKRIRSLDCANPDKTLASCNPSVELPPPARDWRKFLEVARADGSDFAEASARELETIVCAQQDAGAFFFTGAFSERSIYDSSIENLAFILRGVISPAARYQIGTTGPEAPALVDFIMSKDCAISASLTDADKAKLFRIKQNAIERAKAQQW